MDFGAMSDADLVERIAALRTEVDEVRALGNERAATGTEAGYEDGIRANDRALNLYEEIKAMLFELQLRERRVSSNATGTSSASVRPTTWEDLEACLEAMYPLERGEGMWPAIKFSFDTGRSQSVIVGPRGAPEAGRVELITGFAKFNGPRTERILEKVYEFAFGGVVKMGDRLYFRDTFQIGKINMQEFHILAGRVAGIGNILERDYGDGDRS